MLEKAIREYLRGFLAEGRKKSMEELGLNALPSPFPGCAAFVTLYRGGKVIASSGRFMPKLPNAVLECLDNSLLALQDPRLANSPVSATDLNSIRIRIDILDPKARRMLQGLEWFNPKSEGLIVLSLPHNTASVLLPNIANIATDPKEFFHIVMKKAGLDPVTTKMDEYILYATPSTVFSDLASA